MIGRARGTIARRILLNYRIDPVVAAAHLPPGFTPKLANGYAIGGICLIRLEHVRPLGAPRALGIASENAAHRYAAFRMDRGAGEDCVYIARRHSSSRLNTTLGGRLVPTVHHPAHISVSEDDEVIDLALSAEGEWAARVRVRRAMDLPRSSAFGSLEGASEYFRSAAVGYSPRRDGTRLDALRLETARWEVRPLLVEIAESRYFGDRTLFPEGSIELDCALLMKNVDHEWRFGERASTAAAA
ncbi:MAG: hypothetical protein E6J24_03655 [Chloroflexi bacterium]|nr:MAG: hypothetical protein E6J24_03655 [Chloroflexota bacterium]